MASKKILITALQPFAHGNVVARAGGVYAMNAGDAAELERMGFAKSGAKGEPEQTQLDQAPQAKQAGDVVVDDADDLLGDGKAAPEVENKMARTSANKSTAKK